MDKKIFQKWCLLANGATKTVLFLIVVSTALAISEGNAYCNVYQYLTQWGSQGSGNGQFSDPFGMAVDSSGNDYVADGGNNRTEKDAIDGNCAATVTSNGEMHIPIVAYNGSYFWANLQCAIAPHISCTLINYGIVSDVSPYNCPTTILSYDLMSAYIPDVMYNGISYSTGWQGSGNSFALTSYGQNTVPVQSYTLTEVETGTGSGTIIGASISCGSVCYETLPGGIGVILTATAASGSTFAGWSGCDSTSGHTCTVTMNQDRSVTATFTTATPTYTLTVTKTGSGSGTVTGTGINCGRACYENLTSGTQLFLVETANSGSIITNWAGCDSISTDGTTCTVTMNKNRSVTATFSLADTLTVNKSGTGSGTVTGAGTLNCGTTCSEILPRGTPVTLAATPSTGSLFTSWTGCDSLTGTGDTNCTITGIASDRAVTAEFDIPVAYSLAVMVWGNGLGNVNVLTEGFQQNPTLIARCPQGPEVECDAGVPADTTVALQAYPDPGTTFNGWLSGCDLVVPNTPSSPEDYVSTCYLYATSLQSRMVQLEFTPTPCTGDSRTKCPIGGSNESSECTDILTDPNNCGSCGNVCPQTTPANCPPDPKTLSVTGTGIVILHGLGPGEYTCVNGQCVATQCCAGWATCESNPGYCNTDLGFDSSNCGSCGSKCGDDCLFLPEQCFFGDCESMDPLCYFNPF